MTTLSADPVRACVYLLRAAGFTVHSDALPEGGGSPRSMVKFVGGDSDAGYTPHSVYSVDVLSFAQRPSQARRLAVRIHDVLKVTQRQRIETAGLVNALTCTVPPIQIWSDDLKQYYFAQTWDIELGYIDGVD